MSADLDYTLLARYFAGLCASDEARELEAWAAARVERRREVERLREVWDRAGQLPLGSRAEVGLRKVAQRVELAAVSAPFRSSVRVLPAIEPRPRRPWLPVAGTAATFIIAVAAAWLARHRLAHDTDARPAFTVISTALGQRLGLKLSDGTQVTLAPGSTLRTPADFGKASRLVELEGEAVFAVTHDSTRPFAVRTSRALATDLGTRFVVRAYLDDAATDIVVANGSVAVHRTTRTAAAGHDSVVVGRGERATISGNGELQFSRGVVLDDYLGWAEGRLTFRGITLAEAAKQLSRWYDIEIRLEPGSIGDRRIQAAADNEPALEVLRTIAASLDLRLSRSGRAFTLTAK